MKITKKTIIFDIIEKYPDLAKTLQEKYHLHCAGCVVARFETIYQGAKIHGLSDKKIEKMIKELNEKIKKLK